MLECAGKKLDEVETLIAANPNQALREISLRGVRRWKSELQGVPKTAQK